MSPQLATPPKPRDPPRIDAAGPGARCECRRGPDHARHECGAPARWATSWTSYNPNARRWTRARRLACQECAERFAEKRGIPMPAAAGAA